MASFREFKKELEENLKGIKRCLGCNDILDTTNAIPTNKSRCLSCIDEKQRQWRDTKGVSYLLWMGARSRARKADIPFNIEPEDVIVPTHCPVFGVPLERASGDRGAKDNSPTLDKLVPALGYVKGNVQVISWKANRLKSNGSLEDFRAIVRWLERT